MKTELLIAAAACLAAAGCEHKSPHDDQGIHDGKNPWLESQKGSAGSGAAAPTPATPATPNDPNANGGVLPPVAADYAKYTADLTGTGNLTATIDTNQGTIHCQLFGDKVPVTVANFVGLATGKKAWMDPKSGQVQKGKPFYDGLSFHRVIPGFMIQGGDPTGTGMSGPGYNFDDEIVPDLTMQEGTLAMANAGSHGGHGTNGSQFFITEGKPDWLNGKHTIFGQCKELDVVKKITALHGPGDKPTEPVTITKITISKA